MLAEAEIEALELPTQALHHLGHSLTTAGASGALNSFHTLSGVGRHDKVLRHNRLLNKLDSVVSISLEDRENNAGGAKRLGRTATVGRRWLLDARRVVHEVHRAHHKAAKCGYPRREWVARTRRDALDQRNQEWPAVSRLRARDRARAARPTVQHRRRRRAAAPLAPTGRRAAARPAPRAGHHGRKPPRRPGVAATPRARVTPRRARVTAPRVQAGAVRGVALRRARAATAQSGRSRAPQARPVDRRLPSEPPPRESLALSR